MSSDLVKIHDLKEEANWIQLVQKATLETEDSGLVPEHGLFGSPDWWRAIEEGVIPVHIVEGIISRVYMTGMNDWPEFEIDNGGEKSSWTRQGDDEMYQVGKRAKVKFVYQRPKLRGAREADYQHEIVLEIWVSREVAGGHDL